MRSEEVIAEDNRDTTEKTGLWREEDGRYLRNRSLLVNGFTEN